MFRLFKTSILFAGLAYTAHAQVAVYVISGPNLPSHCSVAFGSIYFKTTGGAGVSGLYQCGPTDNTWTYVGNAGSGGVTGSGTSGTLPNWNGTTSLTNSNETDDGTTFGTSLNLSLTGPGASGIALFDVSGNPVTPVIGQVPTCNSVSTGVCTAIIWSNPIAAGSTVQIANNTSTGTTLNKPVKTSSAAGSTTAVLATGTTVGMIGICTSGCGTSGTATITTQGLASCVFVGATTVNDYVTNDSSTGDCSDTGATTAPNNTQVLGRVLSTNASAGTYTILINGPFIIGAASAGQTSITGHNWLGNKFATSVEPSYGLIGTNDTSVNWYAAGAGSANAQTVTLTPQMTTYVAGVTVVWLPSNANSGAATINVNALGTKSLTKCGTTALVANDLTTSAIARAVYDGTRFQLLNPQSVACGAAGATSSTGTLASLPAAGTAGNIYYSTDSVYSVLRDNGSSWDYFFRGLKVTPPTKGSFTNRNFASAGATLAGITTGPVFLSAPGSGGLNAAMITQASPATPYTYTIGVIPALNGTNYIDCGVGFYEVASGKMEDIEIFSCSNGSCGNNSGVLQLTVNSLTALSGGSLTNRQSAIYFPQGMDLIWLRINADGTNLNYSYSFDGSNFVAFYSEAKNTAFTTAPDNVGFTFMNQASAGVTLVNGCTFVNFGDK